MSVSLLLGVGSRDTVYGDGYHDALLMGNISPEQWAKKQKEQVVSLKQDAETRARQATQPRQASEGRGALQAGTGMPSGKQEPEKQWWEKETGKISGKEKEKEKEKEEKEKKKEEGTIAVVDSPVMRSMADKLMEYLQYMIPENILQHEFPNFPKDKIPEYRREAKEILREMGVSIVKQLIERIAIAKKGTGMERNFEVPFGRPLGRPFARPSMYIDCTTAAAYVADLEETLNGILAEASESPAGVAALVKQLAELMALGDNDTANEAQGYLAKVLSKDIPLENADDFLTVVEALQPLASQTMVNGFLQKMWSDANIILLLSVLEIGRGDAAKRSLEEINSRIRRNEPLLSAAELPALGRAIYQGPSLVRQQAERILRIVLSNDIPVEGPEDFLAIVEALETLASQLKGALPGLVKARLQKTWSGASVTLLLSVLEVGGAEAAKCSLEEIDSRLRRNTPLLRETDLPVMEKALRLGSDPVRQQAKRILCQYFARCGDESKLKLLARNDEVGHVANEAVEELPHPNIVALIEMAERSGLKEVAQRLRDCAEKLRPTLPSTADGLLDALKSGEENKQAAALEKLIENANAEIAQRLAAEPQALTVLLSSPRADLRLRAIRLCEKAKLKAAAPQLIDMLLDADDQVFRASCDALFRIVGQADLIPGPFDTLDERKKAVKALKEWYQKQGN